MKVDFLNMVNRWKGIPVLCIRESNELLHHTPPFERMLAEEQRKAPVFTGREQGEQGS